MQKHHPTRGSSVAEFLGWTLGWYQVGDPAGFLASLLGAILLLLVYRLVIRR